MNAAERQEIRARADKATPGPWRAIGTDVSAQIPGWESRWYVAKCKIPEPVLGGIETFPSMANADFIAAARTDIPRLLDALDAAEAAITAAVAAERERAAKVCDQAADFYGSDLQNVDFAARIALTGLVDALKIVAKQIRRGGAE